MAGVPKRRAMEAWIEDLGGQEAIFERIASGEPLTHIAKSIGVSRPMLATWCNAPERRAQYEHARQQSSGALVERGLDILDHADWREAQLAKARAEYRRWMAGIYDDTYKDKASGATQINVENLHIGALQQAGRTIEHDPQALPDWTE